jgi:hypothetical protein
MACGKSADRAGAMEARSESAMPVSGDRRARSSSHSQATQEIERCRWVDLRRTAASRGGLQMAHGRQSPLCSTDTDRCGERHCDQRETSNAGFAPDWSTSPDSESRRRKRVGTIGRDSTFFDKSSHALSSAQLRRRPGQQRLGCGLDGWRALRRRRGAELPLTLTVRASRRLRIVALRIRCRSGCRTRHAR